MSNLEGPTIELEQTYLAKEIPVEIEGVAPDKILDVYIPANLNVHSHVRLRKKGNTYEITKKVPVDEGDASALIEYTISLESDEFETLVSASNKRIEKDRYKVMIEGQQSEVDIFRGLLQGLVIIDFEFDTGQQKSDFKPPSCCLTNVTQEDFIAGGNLAGKSYADIAPELERYGYQPL